MSNRRGLRILNPGTGLLQRAGWAARRWGGTGGWAPVVRRRVQRRLVDQEKKYMRLPASRLQERNSA